MHARRLEKYLKLTRLIERLETEKKAIREEILAAKEFPSTYQVSIKEFEKSRLLSIKDIKDRSRKLYDMLITNGVIYTTKETRVSVEKLTES